MSVSVLPTLTQAGIKRAGATYYVSLIISILFCLLWVYLMIYVQIPMGILEVLLFWFLNPWWDLMMLTGFAWANAAWQSCGMCDKAQCGGECGCSGNKGNVTSTETAEQGQYASELRAMDRSISELGYNDVDGKLRQNYKLALDTTVGDSEKAVAILEAQLKVQYAAAGVEWPKEKMVLSRLRRNLLL